MLAQFSTAIGAMLGTVIGLLAKDFADSTAWVLPLTAGGFIYIATTTVCACFYSVAAYSQCRVCRGVGWACMVGLGRGFVAAQVLFRSIN